MRLRLFIVVAAAAVLTGSAPPAGAEPDPAPVRRGAWPLVPRPAVEAGFDPPATSYDPGHRGVDLAGQAGQAVHSTLPGTVTFAARLAGRGVVVVDHGGIRTTYEPVTASVGVGATVARGGRIGALQRTSSHCFPRACLHWGLLRGRTYLDPLTLVGGGPVRLLPLEGGTVRGPTLVTGAGLPAGAGARLRWTPVPSPPRAGWPGTVRPV